MVRVWPLKVSPGEEATLKLSTVLLLEVLLSVIVPVPATTGSLKVATRLASTGTSVALSAGTGGDDHRGGSRRHEGCESVVVARRGTDRPSVIGGARRWHSLVARVTGT